MPIVAMDDVRFPINCGNYFKYSPCKKCKTLRIIIMPVNSVALKVILIIKEIVNNTVCLFF